MEELWKENLLRHTQLNAVVVFGFYIHFVMLLFYHSFFLTYSLKLLRVYLGLLLHRVVIVAVVDLYYCYYSYKRNRLRDMH